MGYYISQVSSKFSIPASKTQMALAALRHRASEPGFSWSWVNEQDLKNAQTLQAAMAACRWEVYLGEYGSVVDIRFMRDKLGEDLKIFELLAPYVTRGSYIRMSGEDGEMWSWKFNGKACREVPAKIVW